MSAVDSPRVQDLTVVLVDEEVFLARSAVRKKLVELRKKYVQDHRRGRPQYAEAKLRGFDAYLDLYERLGGDPDEVRDPEDGAA